MIPDSKGGDIVIAVSDSKYLDKQTVTAKCEDGLVSPLQFSMGLIPYGQESKFASQDGQCK